MCLRKRGVFCWIQRNRFLIIKSKISQVWGGKLRPTLWYYFNCYYMPTILQSSKKSEFRHKPRVFKLYLTEVRTSSVHKLIGIYDKKCHGLLRARAHVLEGAENINLCGRRLLHFHLCNNVNLQLLSFCNLGLKFSSISIHNANLIWSMIEA